MPYSGASSPVPFNSNKFHHFIEVPIGEFSIETFHQGLSLFAGQVFIPDFLGSLIGSPANAKLDKGGVVMKVIYLVINTVVFAVGHLCSKEAGLKSCVLNRVLVCLLVYPSHIVAQIVYLDVLFWELIGLQEQKIHQINQA